MLTVIDSAVIVFLLFGALLGFKRGIIKSAVSFVGILIVIGLSFSLKNSLSEFLYTHLPFFNIGGSFAGISILNVLIYETIAFLLLAILFSTVLGLVIKLTGIIEKILDLTIVLGFFSKILGLLFGFVTTYIIIFAILFVCYNFTDFSNYIAEGNITSRILDSTPILTNSIDSENKTIKEIMNLKDECGDNKNEC